VVTNHPKKITNSTVKKYLKKQDFYNKVDTLAKLLQPIKNTILMLEGNQTNLADAFIQMIRLGYVIKKFNSTEGLRSGIYSLITSTAGNIWKAMENNLKSCEDLFLQMRHYKLELLATDDTKNYLQQLALHILSVTPHSASCERVFSTLGWIYEKRRLRLQTSKVESMAKIQSFYISKVNEELKYASSKYSQSELKVIINELLDNLEEDFEVI
ncbi:3711_t:CDS:2, partial [Rhizophagus irregularis]